MGWLRRLANSVRRRGDLRDDIDEELRFHLDEAANSAREQGASDADARLQALRRFGNPISLRERTRDADIVVQLERLWQDFRFGVRAFARTPALTLIAVLSIAF